MLKNKAVRFLLLLGVLFLVMAIRAVTGGPRSSRASTAPAPARAARTPKPAEPKRPSPCLDAQTWVKAAASTPTTQWRHVVDAVGINDIVDSQLIVQVNSDWFAEPRGMRKKFAMDIDEMARSHSKGCTVVFWDRKQSRVVTRSMSGELEIAED